MRQNGKYNPCGLTCHLPEKKKSKYLIEFFNEQVGWS